MNDTIESLRQQLAECQATNLQMRGLVDQFLVENDTTEFGCACHPGEGYTCGTCRTFDRQLPLRQALALPNDATCLNELIAERVNKAVCEMERIAIESEQERTASLTAEVERLKAITIPVNIDYGDGAEEVAYGNEHQVRRLKKWLDKYFQIRQQNAELTAQRDAAMKDVERLDWLLKNTDATVCSDGVYGPFHIWFRYSNRTIAEGSSSAREAIDAAIANGKGGAA